MSYEKMGRLGVLLLLASLLVSVSAQVSNLCSDKLDLIVALDSSPSVQYHDDNNWATQIAFARAVKNMLKLGPDMSRIGFVRFDDEAAVEMSMEVGVSSFTADSYLDMLLLRKNTYRAQTTDMEVAARTIRTEFQNNKRPGFTRVLLFISDGEANVKVRLVREEMLKLGAHEYVKVIPISITYLEEPEKEFLNSISTDRINPYRIEDNATLSMIFTDLSRVCQQRDIVEPDDCFDKSGAGDIVFILDSSGSITKNGKTSDDWELAKGFLSDLIFRLKSGAKDSHISLIEFSDTERSRIVFNMNELNSTEMRKTVLNLNNIGSTTDTTTALRLATNIMRGSGNRMGVPDVVILLTDGHSNVNTGSAVVVAEQMHRERVTVLCVGITDKVKLAELAAISSPPHKLGETYWVAPGFDTLNDLMGRIYDRVCDIVPPSPQPNGPIDLCFILDVSGSITYNNEKYFFDYLDFVKDTIFSFEIGLSKTRVALITFSTNATLQFDLDDYGNVAEIHAHINGLQNEKGKTNIEAGLRMARTQVFVPSGGHRPNARGIIFLMTDGKDTQNSNYWREAQTLQHDMGIEIFSIGITEQVDMNQLYVIASNPKPQHVFIALDIRNLFSFVGQLFGSVENKTTTSAPEPTPPTTFMPPQDPSRIGSGVGGGLFGQAQPAMPSMGCKNPADLLIIIDVSSATTPADLEVCKQLVRAIVMASNLGPSQGSIEVMTIGARITRLVRFGDALSKEDIIRKVEGISHQGGTKDLALLLDIIARDVFDKGSADRTLYPNLVLFLMAGGSTNPKATIQQAALLRKHAIHTLVLGVGSDVNMAEAYAIASYPQHFNFRPNIIEVIKTPQVLQQSAASLVDILCNNVNECQESPCQFSATCIDTIDSFACQCAQGRGGARCTAECSGNYDIVVAIDEAAIKTPEDALSVFRWTQTFIDLLPAGVTDTHVSLVSLKENNVSVIFRLNQFLTKIERLHEIPLFSYGADWVDLDFALQYIDDNVFSYANGNRPDKENIIILVSNGNTTNYSNTRRSPNGARVIAVTQRKYARWQHLESLVSDPVEANIIASNDYPYMSEILRDVVSRICDGGEVCQDSPCGNGGSCISMGDEFICKCQPPFTGVTCQESPTAQCQLDLVVIIDVSGRQSSQRLDDVKRFLIGIVESVDVSPDGTHMGLIIFSDRATTKLTLNNPVGKQKLLQEIDSLVWEGNDSNLMEALRRVVMDMTRDSRPHADKVILLFTDGAPTIKSQQTLDEALQVKLEGWRLMVFSVGLDLDPVKIRALASHPVQNNAIILDDWQKLMSKQQWVTDQLCNSRNSCEEKPCKNSGTCERVWDSHICHCPLSFGGPNCQKRCALPLKYDLALLADESAGNSPSIHWRMLSVIWGLLDALTFDVGATNMAFATFSNYTAPRWSLGQRNSKRHLMDLVSLGKTNAFSDVMSALRTAKSHMFTASQGNRADVNNVIIMLVDASHHVDETSNTNILSDLQSGDAETTTVFVVAFGRNARHNPNLAKLASATTQPYFSHVETDDDVIKAVDVILNALCRPLNY